MKITLELSPDLEARLRESTARQNVDTVRCLLLDAFTPTIEALLQGTPDELADAEFEALADQLSDELTMCRGPKAPSLPDYAVSRAGVYE
jgi:hypothetical protein